MEFVKDALLYSKVRLTAFLLTFLRHLVDAHIMRKVVDSFLLSALSGLTWGRIKINYKPSLEQL